MSAIQITPEARAITALEQIRHHMKDVAQWSYPDVSRRDLFPAEFLRSVRRAVRPMFGRVIVGNIMLNRYYDLRPGDKPPHRYEQDLQDLPRGNDVRGVLTGLVNVTVPTWGNPKDNKRFCLRLAPLARYTGEDAPVYQEYYDNPHLAKFYDHAVGVEANAGRSALLMVNTLRPGWTHFPEGPQDSLPILRTFRELQGDVLNTTRMA